MKNKTLNILLGILIGIIIQASLSVYLVINYQQKQKDTLKDYQISLDIKYIYLYDNNKLIGRCEYQNTALDSLISKDNQ